MIFSQKKFKNIIVTGGSGFIGCNLIQKLIKETMEGVLDSTVPLVVDLDVGKSWLEAH